MSNLFYLPRIHSQAGAKLYFRVSGTSTPQNTYTDVDLATPHSNPVVADAEGYFDPIYLDPSLPNYRVIHTDGSNVDNDYTLELLLEPIRDDIPSSSNVSSGYRVVGTAPSIVLRETDGASNAKAWRFRVDAGVLSIQYGDDAESTWVDVLPPMERVQAEGSFSGTLTGLTTSFSQTIQYQRIGNFVRLWTLADYTGTSNSTAMTLTGLPAALYPPTTVFVAGFLVHDNSANAAGSAAVSGAGTITFLNTFTGSGTKGLKAGWSLEYPV
jgi:hypothetical protein